MTHVVDDDTLKSMRSVQSFSIVEGTSSVPEYQRRTNLCCSRLLSITFADTLQDRLTPDTIWSYGT